MAKRGKRNDGTVAVKADVLKRKRIMFLPAGKELSKKRVKVFENLVSKHNGRVVKLQPWAQEESGSLEALDILVVGEDLVQNVARVASILADEHSVQVDAAEIKSMMRSVREFQECLRAQTLDVLLNRPERKPAKLNFGMVPLYAMSEVLKEERKIESSSLDRSEALDKRPVEKDIAKQRMGVNKRVPDREKFVCQHKQPRINHNARITEQLQKLSERYKNDKELWRHHSYRKAIRLVEGLPYELTEPSQVDTIEEMRGIGKKIAAKIKEVLSKGKISKLEAFQKNPEKIRKDIFLKIHGIGPSNVSKLMKFTTLDEVRAASAKYPRLLSHSQKVGLQYYDDIQKRIPRQEVTSLAEVVKSVAYSIWPKQDLEFVVGGSYRRGMASCGDMDILISFRNNPDTPPLRLLLEKLTASGFLTAHLKLPDTRGPQASETYMGLCQLQADLPHRRIDIKAYPRKCFAFALLYFTGDELMNRSIRLYARKLGFTLSDTGLCVAFRNGKKECVLRSKSVVCNTEEEIFEALGLEYIPPKLRNQKAAQVAAPQKLRIAVEHAVESG